MILSMIGHCQVRTANAGKSKGWALDRVKMYSYTGDWATFTYYCSQKMGPASSSTLEKLVRYMMCTSM